MRFVILAILVIAMMFSVNAALPDDPDDIVWCRDLDGNDPNTAGNIRYRTDGSTTISTALDTCEGDGVKEYYCLGSSPKSRVFDCEHSCLNGACQENIEICEGNH